MPKGAILTVDAADALLRLEARSRTLAGADKERQFESDTATTDQFVTDRFFEDDASPVKISLLGDGTARLDCSASLYGQDLFEFFPCVVPLRSGVNLIFAAFYIESGRKVWRVHSSTYDMLSYDAWSVPLFRVSHVVGTSGATDTVTHVSSVLSSYPITAERENLTHYFWLGWSSATRPDRILGDSPLSVQHFQYVGEELVPSKGPDGAYVMDNSFQPIEFPIVRYGEAASDYIGEPLDGDYVGWPKGIRFRGATPEATVLKASAIPSSGMNPDVSGIFPFDVFRNLYYTTDTTEVDATFYRVPLSVGVRGFDTDPGAQTAFFQGDLAFTVPRVNGPRVGSLLVCDLSGGWYWIRRVDADNYDTDEVFSFYVSASLLDSCVVPPSTISDTQIATVTSVTVGAPESGGFDSAELSNGLKVALPTPNPDLYPQPPNSAYSVVPGDTILVSLGKHYRYLGWTNHCLFLSMARSRVLQLPAGDDVGDMLIWGGDDEGDPVNGWVVSKHASKMASCPTCTPALGHVAIGEGILIDENGVISVDPSIIGGGDPPSPGLPDGGTEGQYLKKDSSEDYDAVWADFPDFPDPLPEPGTDGQVLTLASGEPVWADAPNGLPDPGDDGQILMLEDGEPIWADAPDGLPDPGTAGQVLTLIAEGEELVPSWEDATALPDGTDGDTLFYDGFVATPAWTANPLMKFHALERDVDDVILDGQLLFDFADAPTRAWNAPMPGVVFRHPTSGGVVESGLFANMESGTDTGPRLDMGWGGSGGGNFELYSKSHATRAGEFRVVYGGGDYGRVIFTRYNGTNWKVVGGLSKEGRFFSGLTDAVFPGVAGSDAGGTLAAPAHPFQVYNEGTTLRASIRKDGVLHVSRDSAASAPSDESLGILSWALYQDAGAVKLKVKDASGTVLTHTLGGSGMPSGSAAGQILVWNHTSSEWELKAITDLIRYDTSTKRLQVLVGSTWTMITGGQAEAF